MDKFPNLIKPSHLFATLFGIGLLPLAPGTWGSLFGLFLFFYTGIYLSVSQEFFYFLLVAIILISLAVCFYATRDLDATNKDQKSIVIDELAGIWVAFIPVAGSDSNAGFCFLFFLSFHSFLEFLISGSLSLYPW
jgi:phosphatidylglycerophosphatase A